MANNIDLSEAIEDFQNAQYGKDVRAALVEVAEAVEDAINDQVIELDTTLSQSGQAADAAVVGTQLQIENITFTSGEYIRTNYVVGTTISATPITSSAYSYAIVPCSKGDTFLVSGVGGGQPRLWAWTDSSYMLLAVSAAALTASNLALTAPADGYLILNSETSGLGVCIKNVLSETVANLQADAESNAKTYPIPGVANIIKELYIPDMTGYEIYKIDTFMGVLAQSTGLYFSEIRLYFNNNSNTFSRLCLQQGYESATAAIDAISDYNNRVYPFSVGINGTNDTLNGYILFDVSAAIANQQTQYYVESNDLGNLYYSPTIANTLALESIEHRVVCHPNDNAIGADNSYQAPDNFMPGSAVTVFHNGTMVDPSEYTLYDQGKIVFSSDVNYSNDSLMFDYTRRTREYPDFYNSFAENRAGMKVYEQGGSNMYSFVADPDGGTENVIKLSTSSNVSGTLLRCQLFREVTYTEYWHEVKIYVPSALVNAFISYPGAVTWFAISSDWAPFGSPTGNTSNLYSGSSNMIQLYKANADDSAVYYNISNRKRTLSNGTEVYETLTYNVSDFKVVPDEWITLRVHVKVGNPGIFALTVIDSGGTHNLAPLRGGQNIAYVGVADPENESDIYGANVAATIPQRVITEIMAVKLYTSSEFANYVISQNGDISLYFKDYKTYGAVNVNAFE